MPTIRYEGRDIKVPRRAVSRTLAARLKGDPFSLQDARFREGKFYPVSQDRKLSRKDWGKRIAGAAAFAGVVAAVATPRLAVARFRAWQQRGYLTGKITRSGEQFGALGKLIKAGEKTIAWQNKWLGRGARHVATAVGAYAGGRLASEEVQRRGGPRVAEAGAFLGGAALGAAGVRGAQSRLGLKVSGLWGRVRPIPKVKVLSGPPGVGGKRPSEFVPDYLAHLERDRRAALATGVGVAGAFAGSRHVQQYYENRRDIQSRLGVSLGPSRYRRKAQALKPRSIWRFATGRSKDASAG